MAPATSGSVDFRVSQSAANSLIPSPPLPVTGRSTGIPVLRGETHPELGRLDHGPVEASRSMFRDVEPVLAQHIGRLRRGGRVLPSRNAGGLHRDPADASLIELVADERFGHRRTADVAGADEKDPAHPGSV